MFPLYLGLQDLSCLINNMKEKIQQISKNLVSFFQKAIIIAIIGYVLFGIGKSIWRNYQMSSKIESVKSDISEIEEKNKLLQNMIIYYQTDSYKELEARRKLGYKKPGENVLIIPELSTQNKSQNEILPPKNSTNYTTPTPNFIKWWEYVIGN